MLVDLANTQTLSGTVFEQVLNDDQTVLPKLRLISLRLKMLFWRFRGA